MAWGPRRSRRLKWWWFPRRKSLLPLVGQPRPDPGTSSSSMQGEPAPSALVTTTPISETTRGPISCQTVEDVATATLKRRDARADEAQYLVLLLYVDVVFGA